jgi:uncharacterized damage-inducible protein DinB
MKEGFEEWFEYNNNANQKLIALISKEVNNISERILQLINHLINAHQVWNARINSEQEFEVWQINNLKDLLNIDKDNYSKTLGVIEVTSLGHLIEYKNSTGMKFSSKISDILFYVINHSTYHRAQIATELRNCGIESINTDYIFYKRTLI